MTRRRARLAVAAGMVVALTAACGDGDRDATRNPSAAELVGTYDVRTTDRGTATTPGVGTIGRRTGTELSLALTRPLSELTGTLRDDGTVTFTGHTTQSDVIWPVEISGKFEVRGGTIHFVGVRGTEVPSPLDLVMERPLDADLRHFGGSYRLAFDRSPSSATCHSSVVLDVGVDAAGFTTVGPGGSGGSGAETRTADETCDDGDTVVGRVWGIRFHVAPSGRFQIEATWELPDGTCPVWANGGCLLLVDGTLSAGGVTTAADAVLLSGLRTWSWGGTVTVKRLAP